jgi:hypothetical protein
MPYRDEKASYRDRVLALQDEIAVLGQRARELPYLERKRKNLEAELALLKNPRPQKWLLAVSLRFLSISLLVVGVLTVTLFVLHAIGPRVDTRGHDLVDHVEAG